MVINYLKPTISTRVLFTPTYIFSMYKVYTCTRCTHLLPKYYNTLFIKLCAVLYVHIWVIGTVFTHTTGNLTCIMHVTAQSYCCWKSFWDAYARCAWHCVWRVIHLSIAMNSATWSSPKLFFPGTIGYILYLCDFTVPLGQLAWEAKETSLANTSQYSPTETIKGFEPAYQRQCQHHPWRKWEGVSYHTNRW